MTPRRLIRWKSFWFGILVLGFLGWAWAFSLQHYSAIQSNSPLGWITVAQFEGDAALLAGRDGQQWEFSTSNSEVAHDPEKYSQALTYHRALWQSVVPSRAVLVASHASLVLFFLIPWSAFLAWRWQRQRKAHRLSNEILSAVS